MILQYILKMLRIVQKRLILRTLTVLEKKEIKNE
jgi:hypothetical protein